MRGSDELRLFEFTMDGELEAATEHIVGERIEGANRDGRTGRELPRCRANGSEVLLGLIDRAEPAVAAIVDRGGSGAPAGAAARIVEPHFAAIDDVAPFFDEGQARCRLQLADFELESGGFVLLAQLRQLKRSRFSCCHNAPGVSRR